MRKMRTALPLNSTQLLCPIVNVNAALPCSQVSRNGPCWLWLVSKWIRTLDWAWSPLTSWRDPQTKSYRMCNRIIKEEGKNLERKCQKAKGKLKDTEILWNWAWNEFLEVDKTGREIFRSRQLRLSQEEMCYGPSLVWTERFFTPSIHLWFSFWVTAETEN